MKSQSELFKKLFNKPVWVGSFSKKTKVGFPEEYDINLEIKLPIKESNFEVQKHNSINFFISLYIYLISVFTV